MKREVIKILKEKGRADIFTDDRSNKVKAVMRIAVTKDMWLKMYLSLDPLNKAQWVADHLILCIDKGSMC